jgi:Cyclin, N-terminal domain
MVDWMVEVLTTFKNSDQTFLLAINLMDRYFKNVSLSLPSSELHLVGVVSMFVASKYEDIVPLMMKTVVNKIGHNKFELRQIEEKELDLLRVNDYKVGVPTVKEFLDRFLEELSGLLSKQDRSVYRFLMCLAKMTCFSYDIQQLPVSL